MPIIKAIEATDKFRENFETRKFKKENLPNKPPYQKGSKGDSEKHNKDFQDFLNSNSFEKKNK